MNRRPVGRRSQNDKDVMEGETMSNAMRGMLGCGVAALAMLALAPQAGAQTPRSGGTFNYVAPYGSTVSTLDLHRTTRNQDAIVGQALHCMLYRWDSAANKPVPDLIKEVRMGEDGRSFTMTIRDNAKFHNGRPLTADDVIWTFHRIMDPQKASPAARFVRIVKGAKEVESGAAKEISGLKKTGPYTIAVEMTGHFDPGYMFFQPFTAILPKEEVEAKGDEFGSNPVGCGPFRFAEWIRGSKIVVTRFDGYYRQGMPYLDKINFNLMEEASARDLAFRAKELDATVLGSAQYEVYKNDPVLSKNLLEVAEAYTRHIGFNPAFEPFKDKRVRQAFNHAIDSKLIIAKLLKNKAVQSNGWLPTTVPGHDPEAKGYPYDPNKARQLLKEAGYERGFTVEVVTPSNEAYGLPIVEATIPFLAKVGITVKPKLVENAVGQQLIFEKTAFEAYAWSLGSGPNPLEALMRFHSKTPHTAGNYVDFVNPEYDAILDKAAVTADEAERNALFRQANAVLTDAAPVWFFNYNKAVLAYQPWVRGLQPNSIELLYQPFEEVWLDASSPRATAK